MEKIISIITSNYLAGILYFIGIGLLLIGLILKLLIHKEKKKINSELAKKIIHFASIFPGEKVFIWPVLNFEIFEELAIKNGFKAEFGFDKWFGYFQKTIGKSKRKFYLTKDLKLKDNYHHLLLFKKPTQLNLDSLKNIKIVTYNFEIESLKPAKVDDGFYLYKL